MVPKIGPPTDTVHIAWHSIARALPGRPGLGLVCALLLVSSAAVPVGAAADQESSPSAADALEVRDRAIQKLTRLRQFDARTSIAIDASVTRSVADHIQQGNISFRDSNYKRAIDHYERAITQANAALAEAYNAHTALLLNASQTHLQALAARGYDSAEVATLQERRQTLVQRRADVASFGEARDLHRDAKALHADVEALPTPEFVRFVNGYYTAVIPLQLALVLVAALLGAALMRWYLGPSEDDESGGGGGKEFTPTTMD